MELLFWLLLVLINCSGNAITTWMDANRSGAPSMEWWEPWVWEFSSGLVWLLLLVPAIVWFSRRWPLHLDNWRRRLPVECAALLDLPQVARRLELLACARLQAQERDECTH